MGSLKACCPRGPSLVFMHACSGKKKTCRIGNKTNWPMDWMMVVLRTNLGVPRTKLGVDDRISPTPVRHGLTL